MVFVCLVSRKWGGRRDMALAAYNRRSKATELKRTSSLNKFVLCGLCGRREATKWDLAAHLAVCEENRTCDWCNILFKNRGNLFTHIRHLHGKNTSLAPDSKKALPVASHACSVCPKAYTQGTNLRYHIRREHYNLTGRAAGRERAVDEVWLERVLNSDAVVEIRRASWNTFHIRRAPPGCEPPEPLEPPEPDPEDLERLSVLYPTHLRRTRVWCEVCQKTYSQRDFRKHIKEKHENVSRHGCATCGRAFKRPYQYFKHNCEAALRRRAADAQYLQW